MRIELININGRLVGRRFQDRWNLETLGISPMDGLAHDSNSSALKRLRRANTDFTFSIVKTAHVEMTDSDRSMFSPHSIYSQVA